MRDLSIVAWYFIGVSLMLKVVALAMLIGLR